MRIRFVILVFFVLATASCKKQEEPSQLSLLTQKTWRPYYMPFYDPVTRIFSSSSFKDCEVNDKYSFSSNLLTITRGPSVCQYNAFNFDKNPVDYTVDFDKNVIGINNNNFYITKLTTDTLKIYGKISYLSGTIDIPYIFVH
jgi:hypothetical protein